MSLRTIGLLALALLASCATTADRRHSAGIQWDLGRYAMQEGDAARAMQQFQRALEIDPDYSEVHNDLGLAYTFLGQHDDALLEFQRALELNPEFTDVFNNLGNLEMQRGHTAEAEQWFRKAMADITYSSRSYAEGNLGWLLYRQGEIETAAQHIKNAVGANPTFCRGLLWLGQIYQEQKDPTQSRKHLDRFITRCVDDREIKKHVSPVFHAEALYRIGLAASQLGQQDDACQAFRSCVSVQEDGPFTEECTRSLSLLACTEAPQGKSSPGRAADATPVKAR